MAENEKTHTIRHNLPDPSEVFGTPGDGPIPHYPNWLYHCPVCNKPYEIDVKWTDKFMTKCPDCTRKELAAIGG